MGASLPVVAIFGAGEIVLRSAGPAPESETRELDCRCYPAEATLEPILIADRPDVLITVGELGSYTELLRAPFQVRKRWLHYERADDLDRMGSDAFYCFLAAALGRRDDAPPLVSVFTPTYRTGARIMRPFRSLLRQDYPDWEWVVFDDSDDNGATFRRLRALAARDHRITIHRMHRHSGAIGEVKRLACMAASGEILLELDHDDELSPGAIGAVVAALARRPDAGFLYTNWAEVFEAGGNARYPEGWAWGYGADHEEYHAGRSYVVQDAPPLNPKTIRHIVSAPNHARVWRRDCYLAIGGHNPALHVADDYELCLRTFLATRMLHLPRLCYVQYYNTEGNTQRLRNAEIQRMTSAVQQYYDGAIHRRLEELGLDDWVWDAAAGRADLARPNPPVAPSYNLVVDMP